MTVVASILVVRLGADVAAAEPPPPTFSRDVAPILFAHCVGCHRPTQIAPMSLVDYRSVRPWSRAIKARVVAREMPPWHADPRFGRFRNARALTPDEMATIVAWVDGGAPEGDPADLPPPPDLADGWGHPDGVPPDLVLAMPVTFEIPADGPLPSFNLHSRVPEGDDRFVRALELRPSNRAVTHHAEVSTRAYPARARLGGGAAWPGGPVVAAGVLTYGGSGPVATGSDPRPPQRRDDRGAEPLVAYVPGRGFAGYRADAGRRLPGGALLVWNLHYQPTGVPERDRQQLGLWLHDGPVHHEVITRRVGETHIVEGRELVATAAAARRYQRGRPDVVRTPFPPIPPHDGDYAVTAVTAVTDDITLFAMSPHMHLRGKDATYVVSYPDGTEEVLLHVPRYDFAWQIRYELETPRRIPAGSTIKAVGHFDNSIRNRRNPAPHLAVAWAEQSWNEMFNCFIEYAVEPAAVPAPPPAPRPAPPGSLCSDRRHCPLGSSW